MNQFTIYRKKIACRFNVNNGFVGFEAANVIPETMDLENPRYDWTNKIIFSFSIDEVGKMIMFMEGKVPEFKSFHSTDSGSKTLAGKKMENGNILMNLDHSPNGAAKKTVSAISIMPENMVVIVELLKSGIFALTNFNPNSEKKA